MANPTYTKSNLLHMFYADSSTPTWAYFGYIQSNGLSMTNNFTEISSKQHGNWADQEVQSSSWTMSQSAYVTVDNANIALKMAADAKPITWCFCKVAEDESVAATGLKPVTGMGDTSTYTIGSSFKKYGNGIVSSASISSNAGEVATIDIDIQGLAGLMDAAPETVNPYSAS